ncbi:SGNH/GDSL hydrolase family protein [Streptomyces chumphonensis]|uniref:SGNH/GDSL hydrolase family protein n=1 Tax=Streptomyces chumphonensis TaxID=1214925 RepID=UPI003D72D4AA
MRKHIAALLALGLVGAVLAVGYLWAGPSTSARERPEAGDDRPVYLPGEARGAAEEEPEQAEPAEREPARVLFIGDSLAMEMQDELGRRVGELDRTTYLSAPYSGTTLCDYLEGRDVESLVPAKDKAAALVRSFRPTVVVLQFWGNSWGYTPCMDRIGSGTPEYYARYTADAERITEQIRGAAEENGTAAPRLVWVLQGPDAMAPDRVRRVNAVYEELAPRTDALLSDAGAAVSRPGARYTWTRTLPCTQEERDTPGYCEDGRTPLHREDDLLHFCLAPTTSDPKPCPRPSPGIDRYTAAITTTVRDHLGG